MGREIVEPILLISREIDKNIHAMKLESGFVSKNLLGLIVGAALVVSSQAQPQFVPNSSFELESGVGQIQNVNINIDSWQKAGRPSYFPATGFNGFFWVQTAGVFNAPAYGNQVGDQAAYLLNFAQAGLFQDFDTRDYNDATASHNFNSIFEVGKSYKLTLGLYGKGMTENVSSLELSLYYRDGFNAIVPVGATTVTFSTNTFAVNGPFNLVDFEVNVPTVSAFDDWAGQNIGIKIASLNGDGAGYWDMDNVRLEAIPEPATIGLFGLGAAAFVLIRRRNRA
jgi:hypothetical protein